MDLSLIETLRWESESGFVRLERHLARLARSAATLGLAGAEKAESALHTALPPSALPGISPSRGEIGKTHALCSNCYVNDGRNAAPSNLPP